MSDRLKAAPPQRPDHPASAEGDLGTPLVAASRQSAGVGRPGARTRAGQPTRALTASYRREAFAAGVSAARQAQLRRRGYVRLLVICDLVVVTGAVLGGYLARFQGAPSGTNVPYPALCVELVGLWMLILLWTRCYDDRVLGSGAEEYRRVASASLKLAGGVAITAYLADVYLSRGFFGIAFAAGTVALPTVRYVARQLLHRARQRNRGWARRVLVVGDASHVLELAHQLRRESYAGYDVVGACIPDSHIAPGPQHLDGVPVVGSFRNILDAAQVVSADTVAVTGSADLTGRRLRRLGWQMEGTGIDMVLAPTLTDVAGPRIHMRPIAGLPLIHVSSPEFRGMRKALKGLVDRVVALVAVVAMAPLLALIALAIRLDSRGPAFFRQTRVGLGGREFDVFKFRSMVLDADAMMTKISRHNETDGLMFKMRNDPRITRVGAFLRTWSLDELPQILNVLKGDMSLVGPRPPLPSEVAWYDQDVARRLLVKPGMTGLWQVSGRSDLSFEDGIRLDLYYVENWSLATDVAILWKTVGAVIRRRGAY